MSIVSPFNVLEQGKRSGLRNGNGGTDLTWENSTAMNLPNCSDLGGNLQPPSNVTSTRPMGLEEGIVQANKASPVFNPTNHNSHTSSTVDSGCLSTNSSTLEAHRQVILKAMNAKSFGSSIPPLLSPEPTRFSETKLQSPGSVEAYRLRLKDGGMLNQTSSRYSEYLLKAFPASIRSDVQFSDFPIVHRACALRNLSFDGSDSDAHDDSNSDHLFKIQGKSLEQLPSEKSGNEQIKRFKRTLQELERELLSDDTDLPSIDQNKGTGKPYIPESDERDWAEVIQDLLSQNASLPSQASDLLRVGDQQILSGSSGISNSQSKVQSSLASGVTCETTNASGYTSPFSQQTSARPPQRLEATSVTLPRNSYIQQQPLPCQALQGNPDTTRHSKQLLISCASAIAENDFALAHNIVLNLKHVTSIYGDPTQRLAAYMTDALVCRLDSSSQRLPTCITANEYNASEVLSAMHVFCQVCPYWEFGYRAANNAIFEAFKGEENVHIIDFKVGQGKQWIALLKDFSVRPGGPPKVRLTGVDDPQSNVGSPGGFLSVGKLLGEVAHSLGVDFEFHPISIKVSDLESSMLQNRNGEVLAVNFAFHLHQMPDESVCVTNPRDRLLRMVRALNPRIVTLVEFEANTNTAPFYLRFLEALGFYTAIFESLDVSLPRENRDRVNVELNCLAKDITNVISCEGSDRIQRYEVAGKWRVRMTMAGFRPYPWSSFSSVKPLLEKYSKSYRLKEEGGTLHLGWLERVLIVASFWQ